MSEVIIEAKNPKTFIQAIQERLKEGYVLVSEAGIFKENGWEFIAILEPAHV
ncbi:hypothetical protein ACO3UB_08375 (plasmid) [Methanocaldococcus sp. 16A]